MNTENVINMNTETDNTVNVTNMNTETDNTVNVTNMNNEVNDTDNMANMNNEILDVNQQTEDNSSKMLEELIARYEKIGNFKITNPLVSLRPNRNHYILDEYESEYVVLQDYMIQFNDYKRDFETAFLKFQQNNLEIINKTNELKSKISQEDVKPEEIDVKLLELNIRELLVDTNRIYNTELLLSIGMCEELHKKCVELSGKITDFSEQAIEKAMNRSKLKQLFDDMYCSIVSGSKSHLNNDVVDLMTVKTLVEDYIRQVKEQIETNNNYPTKQVFNVFLDKMCDLFGFGEQNNEHPSTDQV